MWCRASAVQEWCRRVWFRMVQGSCGAGRIVYRRVWCRVGVVQGSCGAGRMWCRRVWYRADVVQGECGAGRCGAGQMWCRADVVQCGAGEGGAVWCRTSSGVRCRAGVVQASVVQCGAGREWCRAWCRTRFRVWCAWRVWCRAGCRQMGCSGCGAGKCGAASPCWRVVHAMWFVVSGRCGAGGRHISE